MRDQDIILSARGVSKRFGGFVAISDLDLTIRRNTIHALIGPNGAGKTTVFNLLTKFLTPSAGTIVFNGKDVTALGPAAIARLGLVRSFQISAVFPKLTAADNVVVGLQRRSGLAMQFWRSRKVLESLRARALEILEEVGLDRDADMPASSLSYGKKRALELATTLALEPSLLLLDEPMAGMGVEDIGRVSDLIRRIAKGRTVVMVEHNLAVVASLCDRVSVLARGKILAEETYQEIANNPAVREAYMGSEHV